MDAPATTRPARKKWPLYLRVTLGAAIGIALGRLMGPRPIAGTLGLDALAEAGTLVVRALKLVATPLIFFSVLDAVLSSEVRPRSAWRLFAISGMNAAVALLIALGCARWLGSGRGQFALLGAAPLKPSAVAAVAAASDVAVRGSSFLPDSLIEPFRQNNALSVAILGVAFALAFRVVERRGAEEARQVAFIAAVGRVSKQACLAVLGWLVELVPFAVAGVLAAAVSKAGLSTFKSLSTFTGTMILGLALQVFVYYGLLVTLVARRSPWVVLRGLADALLTALSCGSSVATMPVTLRALDRLGVQSSTAQLAAVAGTNLNHVGIILYEAAATLFVAQALGMHPCLFDQMRIAGAALVAGVGMAGVPEAGLVTLPLVLAAGGIPSSVIPSVLPLLLPVDWIIGRCRAATNVASDAISAIMLDYFA
ncbi:MAG TPA: cation:dicarboxylase symporter family transporter [Polyangiaceae bacterium]|jgi:DAACS family dicarboxylate/amino acid:cation (Na+ or H+) symporter|nr:cation:dicarboxylase symporter family transporter [Polyangiaceae bacterium]